MSQETDRAELFKKRVVYQIPGMESATVQRDIEYRPGLTLDIYRPRDATADTPIPAVVFVFGFPDPGGGFRKTGLAISWGQLAAASGLALVVYGNREPAADVHAVLDHLQANAAALGIDATRIGLFSTSGNVPTALSVLMQPARDSVRCAVLNYGFTLDLDGATAVAAAASAFGCANPCAGKSIDDLRPDVPLMLVRSGQDEFAGLNDTLDRFVARALARNLPITLVNHAAAPHGFDLFHDSATSREIIRQILAFLRFHLLE